MRLQQTVHRFPGFRPDFPVFNPVENIFTAQVAGHDQDRVLEIHRPALAVGDPAVIQHLQQHIEHIGMRFFHFIEQDDTIGMAPDGFRQLAAFIIAHISGRRSDQPGDAEFFHVLRHIDPDHILFIIEQGLRQSLGQFGLAHTGGPQKQEGAQGTVGVLDTGPGTQDGF